jgi:DNA-binding HxlR family transcriptional regulator
MQEFERLRMITQSTRGNLVQDILGHPELSPSFDELNYMNPSKNRATLREHIDRLISEEIVQKIVLPESERSRDEPYTFYTLTESGLNLLLEHNLFINDIDEIRAEYEDVEKTEFIKNCEQAKRPESAKRIANEIFNL